MLAIRSAASTLLTVVTTFLAQPAFAEQPQTITLSSRVVPQYMGGKLEGCQLGFEVVRHDPEYSRSELVYLTGNLGFKAYEGKELSVTFKLGVVTPVAPGTATPPAEVFLVDKLRTNVSDFVARADGEEGFGLFVYSVGEVTKNAALINVIKNKNLTFAYAMRPGGLGALVSVDLRIKKIDLDDPKNNVVNDNISEEWVACVKAVLDEAKTRLLSEMSDEELMALIKQDEAAEATADAKKGSMKSDHKR